MESNEEYSESGKGRIFRIGIRIGGILFLSLGGLGIYGLARHGHRESAAASPLQTGSTAPAQLAPNSSRSQSGPVIVPGTREDQEAPDPMNCFAVHDFPDAAHQTPETRQQFAARTNEEAKARGIRVGAWGDANEHLAFIALRDNEAELRKIEARTTQPDMLAGLCVLGFAQVDFSVMDDRTHIETIGRASTNAPDAMSYLKSHPAE